MPTYDYACRKCGKKFSATHSITEHGRKPISCPRCGALKEVETRITPFLAKTSKKS